MRYNYPSILQSTIRVFHTFISQLLEDWSRSMHDVVSLMRTSKEALGEMFDRFTVAEWIEQKLYPMYSRLSKLRQTTDGLHKVSAWPSRSEIFVIVTYPLSLPFQM